MTNTCSTHVAEVLEQTGNPAVCSLQPATAEGTNNGPKDSRSLSSKTTHPQTPSLLEGAIQSTCPKCWAQPGNRCIDRSGNPRTDHAARARAPKKERTFTRAEQEAWCAEHFPGEYVGFVVVAAFWVKDREGSVSVGSVRKRLVATGRAA